MLKGLFGSSTSKNQQKGSIPNQGQRKGFLQRRLNGARIVSSSVGRSASSMAGSVARRGAKYAGNKMNQARAGGMGAMRDMMLTKNEVTEKRKLQSMISRLRRRLELEYRKVQRGQLKHTDLEKFQKDIIREILKGDRNNRNKNSRILTNSEIEKGRVLIQKMNGNRSQVRGITSNLKRNANVKKAVAAFKPPGLTKSVSLNRRNPLNNSRRAVFERINVQRTPNSTQSMTKREHSLAVSKKLGELMNKMNTINVSLSPVNPNYHGYTTLYKSKKPFRGNQWQTNLIEFSSYDLNPPTNTMMNSRNGYYLYMKVPEKNGQSFSFEFRNK